MQYEAPETTKAAVGLLAKAKGSAYVLAGGSDLLVRMKGGFVEPDLVVDIKRIKAMREVKKTAAGFTIGAAVSCAELGENKALVKAWPGVVEAAGLIGSKQVQSRCTVTGNLCKIQMNGFRSLKEGQRVQFDVVQGPKGKRKVAVEDVPVGPGRNALKKGELIEAIELPARKGKSGDAYLRFIPRTEMDIAVVGCGVSLTLDGSGTCTDARVGLGAVAARPLLVADAAKALIGTKVDEAALAKLEAAARAACNPIDDKRGTKEFRIDVAGVLAKRTALIALERARKN